MTDMTMEATATAAPSRLYRAVWRWHFYAGLLTLPFLILLGITGALYLYKDEINRALYADLMVVAVPQGAAAQPPAHLVAAALAAHPDATLRGLILPRWPDAAAQVNLKTAAGDKAVAYVNPYDGRVLGLLADGGSAASPVMLFIRKLHSLEYFGMVPNRLIELVGGWAVILVITGAWLWWPRGQAGGIVSVRGTPSRRVFWRDLHAVTGLFAGLFIGFLALSGLPWSGFWGNQVNLWMDANGYGYPAQFWNEVPKSAVPMKETVANVPWALENTATPASTPDGSAGIGIDQAVAILDRLGIVKGYALNVPNGADGVWSASVFPDSVAQERVIHLDQYSGAVLFDGGWAELGGMAKAIEWGISVHMGQEFGVANQLFMLAVCLAMVAMSVSATVMWWKRRPAGSLGAPRLPEDTRIPRVILGIAVGFGLLFPLVGLSLLVMLGIDMILPRALRARLA